MPLEGEGNAAAEIHGALRASAGFDVNQAAAEYRALRASVLRLWFDSKPELGRTEVFELVRFNESMDEALAASLLHFASEAAHMRNLFLGVLSHELRTPLSTIVASGQLLQMQLKSNPPLLGASERVLRGSRRIESLLDSLLDYVRSGLGEGMRISLERVDLGAICARIVAEVSALYPDREIRLSTSGDLDCDCDEQRIGQAVSNLLTNAYKYGDRSRPIQVTVASTDQDLSVQVQNFGPAIPPATLESFFQPLVRGANVDKQGVNLGLGLYIVREIASAHGGSATVVSNDELGTAFTLRLPRSAHGDPTAAFRGLKMN